MVSRGINQYIKGFPDKVFLNGKVLKNYPSLDILIAMSDLFGITLDHLIKG
ncbi:DNA-binding protein [Staphylococcus aureus]|nr:DNA-binding protein [Staphylococcus aureus]